MNEYETTQKWEDPFKTLLDEIYYPGYAETLAEENPEAYKLEYNNFINLYDEPQIVESFDISI